jgi:hypothetical protein
VLIEMSICFQKALARCWRGNPPELEVNILTLETLVRLKSALGEKSIDAMDAALAKLSAPPLSAKTRESVSHIADLILTTDFKGLSETVAKLIRLGNQSKMRIEIPSFESQSRYEFDLFSPWHGLFR